VATIHDSILAVEQRRKPLKELGLPIIFGAVVLFASALMLLSVNISALRANLGRIEHSQQVLMQNAELETGILGDELTVRGYGLTRDARFLRFQERERARSQRALDALTRLMAADPERSKLFQTVRRDVVEHMANYGKLRGAAADVVAKAIVDPAIRANMRRTRDGLAALRSAEVRDLGDRQREMTGQITFAFLLAIGIILAAFVLGGFGVLASQHGISFRR
jgi:CHASE3 domain sensor protein